MISGIVRISPHTRQTSSRRSVSVRRRSRSFAQVAPTVAPGSHAGGESSRCQLENRLVPGGLPVNIADLFAGVIGPLLTFDHRA
jgi:hypothetical protein